MTGAVDLHHHFVPAEYVAALHRLGVSEGLGVKLPKWSARKSLDVMDANGIATAILSISAPGVSFPAVDHDGRLARRLAREVNQAAAELIRDHPGRFGGFATLPVPDVDAGLAELGHALDELRLDGVIMLSNYGGYYLGHPRFDPIMAELNAREAVVLVHPQSPPTAAESQLDLPEAMLEVTFDTTRTVFSLLVNGVIKKYPKIRFVLAHAGGATPYLAGRVGVTATMLADLRGAMPVIAEGVGKLYSLSSRWSSAMPDQLSYYLRFKDNVLPEGPDHFLGTFYYDTALAASPHCFASLGTLVDSSRIVFGTDYIFATSSAVPLTINGIAGYPGFTDDDRRKISFDNAHRLFPRLSGSPTAHG